MSATISVGATEKDDSIADFSSYGPCTDILAPGRSISGPGIANDVRYVKKSGTSMSTPIVVGMAARYLSSLSEAVANTTTHYQVKAALTDLSTKGVVDLYDLPRLSTPNHLLYKMCGSAMSPETTTTNKYTSRKLPVTQTTTTTTSTTQTITTPSPKGSSQGAWWTKEEVGEMALGLMGVVATLVGTTFGIMALIHINIASRK